jgi:hypothetical protein
MSDDPSAILVAAWLALAVLTLPAAASAFDPGQTFRKGALVLSVEGGFAEQTNVERLHDGSDIESWNAGLRLGVLPFGTSGHGPWYGALEVGLEPYYQRYTRPADAHFRGLAAVIRYHFLSLGRFVPWLELFGAAGGTDLEVREIRSDFTFLVQGGIGGSFFFTERAALYGGYRFQHVSNGNTSPPNRGFESHAAVFGVSYFFP